MIVRSRAFDQIKSRLRIVNIPVGQDLGDDHTRLINTEMEFLPGALAAPSVLGCGPLAFAHNRWPSAVDDQMDGLVGKNGTQGDIEPLATPKSIE
jgi:hypothetical protein